MCLYPGKRETSLHRFQATKSRLALLILEPEPTLTPVLVGQSLPAHARACLALEGPSVSFQPWALHVLRDEHAHG